MTDASDLDGLAAEYVLGSLDPDERAEVAARRKMDPALDHTIKAWEARLGPLNCALPGIAPPHRVFS
jgi:anti-sigma-K factor RskA